MLLSSFLTFSCQMRSRLMLAIPSREKLTRVLKRVLDEKQFLSPFGIRSLSKFVTVAMFLNLVCRVSLCLECRVYESQPFVYRQEYKVEYTPGESDSPIYGGNSNWRGPVWMPVMVWLVC